MERAETGSSGGGYVLPGLARKNRELLIEMLDVNLQERKKFRHRDGSGFFPNGTSDEMTLVLRSDKNEWRKISLEITTALASVSDKIQ